MRYLIDCLVFSVICFVIFHVEELLEAFDSGDEKAFRSFKGSAALEMRLQVYFSSKGIRQALSEAGSLLRKR